MDLKEYSEATRDTISYPSDEAISYLTLGLNGEAGEVAELVKKAIRSPHVKGLLSDVMDIARMRDELGDVIWYWTRLCEELGFNPEEVLENNIAKLKERQVQGTISER